MVVLAQGIVRSTQRPLSSVLCEPAFLRPRSDTQVCYVAARFRAVFPGVCGPAQSCPSHMSVTMGMLCVCAVATATRASPSSQSGASTTESGTF